MVEVRFLVSDLDVQTHTTDGRICVEWFYGFTFRTEATVNAAETSSTLCCHMVWRNVLRCEESAEVSVMFNTNKKQSADCG